MSKKQKRSASRLLAYLISFAMILVTFWSDYTLAFAADDEIETSIEQEELVEEEVPAVEEEPEVVSDDEAVIEEAGEEVIFEETTGTEETEVIAEEEDADEVSEEATDAEEETEAVEDETEALEETEEIAETEADETEETLETETEETLETETEETLETETETEETELVEYTLYFEAGEGGFVTIEEQVLTEEDEVETVTAIAYSGYQFVNWTKDGEDYSDSKSITPELEDATYVANFEELALEFSQSTVVNGIKISLYAAPGVLPNDAELQVAALASGAEEAVQELIDEKTEDEVVATYSFDINIFSASEGGFVQPEDGTVAVTFEEIPEADDEETTVAVYHVDGSLGNAEQVSGETSSDSVSFDAEHFSIYTITVTKGKDWGKFYIKIVIPGANGYYREIGSVYKNVKEVMTADTISAADLASMLSIPEGYKYLGLISTKHGIIEEFNLQKAKHHSYKNVFYRTVGSNDWHDCENQTLYAACRPLNAVTTANHLDLAFEKTDFDNYKKNAKVYAVVNGISHEMTVDQRVYHEVFDGKDYYEYRYNSGSQLKATDKIEFRVVLANGEVRKMTSTTEVNNGAFERCFLNHFTSQSIFGFDYISVFSVDFKLVGDVEYYKNDGTTEMKADNLNWTAQDKNKPKDYVIKSYEQTGLTTRANYEFAGWATDDTADEEENGYSIGDTIPVMNGETVKLYAVWTPINRNVNYVGVYQTNEEAADYRSLGQQTYLNNTSISVADVRAIAEEYKDNYEIEGIYSDYDCYNEFTGLTVTSPDNVIYIKYNRVNLYDVTVNYEYRYADPDREASVDTVYEDSFAYGTPFSYTAKDDVEGFTLQAPDTQETVIYDNTTLTFVYVQNVCAIKYEDGVADEVVFADQEYTAAYGDYTPWFEGELSREGYEWAGWDPEWNYLVTGDVVYKALWEAKPVLKVTVKKDGSNNKTVMYNGEVQTLIPDVIVSIEGNENLFVIDEAPEEEEAFEEEFFEEEFEPIEYYEEDLFGAIFNQLLGTGAITAYAADEEFYEIPAQDVGFAGRTFTVSGLKLKGTKHVEVGEYDVILLTSGLMIMEDGENLTDRFTVVAPDNEAIGTLTITKRSITLTADSAEKTYDGAALTADGYTVSGDGFVKDDESLVAVTLTGSQTEVGTSANVISVSAAEKINKNYNITLVDGLLTVTASGTGGGDDNDDDDDDDDRADEAGSVLGENRPLGDFTNEDQFEEAGQVLGAGRGKSPKTNDANNAVLWAMIMGTSALGIAAMMAQRRRRKDEE